VRWGAALGCLVAALSVTLVIRPVPLLVWNASASAPIGLYAVDPWATIDVGDQVIARLPIRWRTFADGRCYLPKAVPAVKRVAAANGDRVCARRRTIFVNGRAIAERLPRDGAGRPMPAWTGCLVLDPSHVFLLMPAVGSFDGRYFGMTRRPDVLGRAIPLWTR
jgi:conjugative transfer signal peptidase TraF